MVAFSHSSNLFSIVLPSLLERLPYFCFHLLHFVNFYIMCFYFTFYSDAEYTAVLKSNTNILMVAYFYNQEKNIFSQMVSATLWGYVYLLLSGIIGLSMSVEWYGHIKTSYLHS